MKFRLITLRVAIITLFAVLTSCSLMDDMFDGSEGSQSREFKSKEWSSVKRNAFM